MKNKFSHTDKQGKAKMVDVGNKAVSKREAVAKGSIFLSKETIKLIKENQIKKGDVLTVAKIAGIQVAKKTSELIPLCHPLLLDDISIDCTIFHNHVEITSTVKCTGKTGVEMEALTAVSIALLTVYDMCKAVDKNMKMGDIVLCQKLKRPV
ncbi:molybdenum cofactor biosynthesis protein C [candidate division WOR-1 bacterium RIFOXYD2_FULL_36_8]|uniref:cyclic pyranopterin monophosphate synthase n=1 Tax=candidate division WOR-1 bacterium RIFOXYB2_FULL_36_35 TaxID=1802578 RepID=A0A1F4S7J7_UNCSA|nr:MAG: molybdenum cofactor biosynthesis protein C [candidate division WOR-1 bacterium RIFOXYA2_FULL_36_21]OGC16018.1 MAG: molybdenum cofactor biosynthesis protein C [candidate division WOR-1 bacterium RIFOXYA12_FULL_36_13]OGC16425.1 MAG: molybdenum cofactor biosynthesis protein C [candidate division WOR-1 bacterium RIFOXYB2_FULL_36_35]OGC38766.1 MAG: molybdenum cofactor biosynthesis protein C [candidate division WOR-1 bacterium RIFOXYD2_FULL_36_8]